MCCRFLTGMRTVDNGSEVPHVPYVILIRHTGRSDLVQNFLPQAGHDLGVRGQLINNECKCRCGGISAGWNKHEK